MLNKLPYQKRAILARFFIKKIKHFLYRHDGNNYEIYPVDEVGKKLFEDPIILKYTKTDERDSIVGIITNLLTELVRNKDE